MVGKIGLPKKKNSGDRKRLPRESWFQSSRHRQDSIYDTKDEVWTIRNRCRLLKKKAISGGYLQLRSFLRCNFLLHLQDSESLTVWSLCIS